MYFYNFQYTSPLGTGQILFLGEDLEVLRKWPSKCEALLCSLRPLPIQQGSLSKIRYKLPCDGSVYYADPSMCKYLAIQDSDKFQLESPAQRMVRTDWCKEPFLSIARKAVELGSLQPSVFLHPED